MARFVREINYETGKNWVNLADTSEAPAFVHAITRLRQCDKGVNVPVLNFSNSFKLFKFFSHIGLT